MWQGRLQVRILFVLALCFTFAASSVATKKPPLKPVNINTANSEELQQVPGIGPATADKLLQMRKYLTVNKSAGVNKIARPAVSASPPKKPDPSGAVSPAVEAEDPPH